MKILHITNNYPTVKYPIFGIFVKEQIDSLTDQGLKNEVFFINGREKGKLEYLKSIFKLRKFLGGKNFDVVHCHHALSGLCFFFSGQSKKFKSVISYQNDPLHEQGKYLYTFIRKRFNAIILKNNSPVVDNSTVYYQPNGVNTNFFKPIPKEECIKKLKLRNDKRYILFVSSNYIREQKRYDRFLEVLEILKSKYKLNNIEELKLINTERKVVPYYFNAASLHLLTSDFEGSPNSVKEAMACNTPVVSTNVGNVEELLRGVEGSWVSNTKNAEELAELAYKALQNNNECIGREHLIKNELDIESVAKKITSIYKKIINE
ncbi:MAG: glycosyltransferase family 4 protein [Bacteroidales bacterium]